MADLALDVDGAVEEFNEEFDEGEADAVAAGFAGAGFVDAVEAVEDAREVGGGDADAVVGDGDGGSVAFLTGFDVDGAALRGVFDGVFGQVVEDLPEELGRGENVEGHGGGLFDEGLRLALGLGLQLLDGLVQGGVNLDGAALDLGLAVGAVEAGEL